MTQTGHDTLKREQAGSRLDFQWRVLLHPAACQRKSELRVWPKLNGNTALKTQAQSYNQQKIAKAKKTIENHKYEAVISSENHKHEVVISSEN